MNKILSFLMLTFMCLVAHGQTHNIVKTSYTTTTIAQTVVFDNAMKAGGTFTFSVLAHNGGGNANTDDTANVKILFYNNSTLLHTATTTNNRNLPIPTGYHGVDPAVPWTTLSISSSNCGSSCANVTHAVVQMVGIDGSYWAGNYGPYYQQPTFTFNGGSNILYNSEFGAAPNGTLVQGWSSTAGWYDCQGPGGGSTSCTTNYSSVTANMSNGGYSATGGTTSAAPGGYTAPPPTDWKVIRTNTSPVVISNIYPTSNNSPPGEGAANAFDGNPNTKYLNFDKKNAGVTVQLSQGRVVQKFTVTTANDFSGRDPTSYKLYGSNDGVNWVLIKADTLALSESRFWTSPEIQIGNTAAYVYYFILFPTTKAGDGCGQDCNSMQIGEITFYYDSNDGVTSTMSGSGSTPSNPGTSGSVCADCGPTVVGGTITQTNASSNQTIGSGGTYTPPANISVNQVTINSWNSNSQGYNNELYVTQSYGSNNTVTLTQTGDKNRIDFTLDGNNNSVNSSQTGRNYLKEEVPGWGNNITTTQTNTTGGSNYAETKIQGNGNTVNHTQSGTGNHVLFSKVTGDVNTVSTAQTGSAGHFADVTLTGNGHNALITQSGSSQNNANISLTNAGGAASVDLQQSGGKSFNIQQSCANPAGCSTVVRQ